MASQLVCRPEQDLPVAVLRVTGVLDLVTGTALHHAVQGCLAALPEAVLVDVARLKIRDPAALAVLSAVVSQTAEWPAVPIVLCGAEADTAGRVAASPARLAVGMADSCEQAIADIAAEPEPRRLRVRLRPVPDACRQARQVVNRACAAWHLDDLAATGALIATELVANVVRHARTTMELTVGLRNGRISLAVRDRSTRLPRPADPALTDPGGRGLHLVRELADSWGVMPVVDGKVVWTTLVAPGGAVVPG
jgi:anti-sigma regulatory factor (Ser/Thr protein kinase)/anti-anti-sigma regulatory factor